MYRKKSKRRNRIFNYREFAECFGIHRNTVARKLAGVDLCSLEGVIEAIRVLEGRGDGDNRGDITVSEAELEGGAEDKREEGKEGECRD